MIRLTSIFQSLKYESVTVNHRFMILRPSGLVHFQGDGLRLISKNVKSEEDQTRDAHLLRLEVEAPSGIFVNARCETISNEYEMAELSKLPRSEAARILRCRPAD